MTPKNDVLNINQTTVQKSYPFYTKHLFILVADVLLFSYIYQSFVFANVKLKVDFVLLEKLILLNFLEKCQDRIDTVLKKCRGNQAH